MSTLAISSFSLYGNLGPLRLGIRDADGNKQVFEMPMPQNTTLEEFAVDVRERLGLATIEVCQLQVEDDDRRIETLASALRDAGVEVLTMPIDVGSLSTSRGAQLDEDIADIEHWFDVAVSLGATYVRVNAGLADGDDREEDRASLVGALSALADSASSRGLRLLVENHGGASSEPDYLLGLRSDVGADKLGILLDLGNFPPVQQVSQARMSGSPLDDTQIDTDEVYERIAALAPHADLVHAKAYDARSDGRPLLDIDRALGIVADAGYDGSISVEWEGSQDDPWAGTTATAAAVRRAFPNLVG